MSPHARRRRPWSPSTLNLVALVSGAALGWFLGPSTQVLRPLAGAFLNLLTMLSMPFLVVALIYGLGRLSSDRLRSLAASGGLSLLALYAACLATYWALARVFPTIGNASFYSDPSAKPVASPSLLALLVPDNPFEALAGGVVPGVVFFCLLFAWHLVRLENKDRLLDWLDITFQTLKSMAGAINRVLPLATFLLSLTAFGGLEGSVLSQVRLYVLAAMVASALLSLVVLPALLGAVSPVGYLRTVRTSLPALVTALVTGSAFAALPQISRSAELLLGEEEPEEGEEEAPGGVDPEARAEVSTVIPVALNFPTAGSLLTVLFLFFAGSAFDRPLDLAATARLFTAGLMALFSGSSTAISFLCTLVGVPQDAVSLFFSVNSLTARFSSVLAASSLIVLCALTHYGSRGRLRPSPLRLGLLALLVLGPLALGAGALSRVLVFPAGIRDYYETRSVTLPAGVEARSDSEVPPEEPVRSAMDRLRRGENLRLGLQVDRPPFTYRNKAGQLSGYCVALVALLAEDLEGHVELVEVEPARVEEDLASGRIDLLLSPVQVDARRLRTLAFATAFGTVKPALVFSDLVREAMEDRLAAADWKGLRVGVRRGTFLALQAPKLLPGAALVEVDSPDELLDGRTCDALLWNDLEATAWEVTNPSYDGMVLPGARPLFLGYPLRADDAAFQGFVRTWFEMQQNRGTLEALYQEWILGRGAHAQGSAPVQRLLDWVGTP